VSALGLVAFVYFLLSRLLYAGGVGYMLWREQHDQLFTRERGIEAGWQLFRRRALWIMNNDGVAFVAVVLATTGTMGTPWPAALRIGLGVALCAAGIGIKVWAARVLGDRGYHWHNHFAPHLEHEFEPRGPYRLLKNPMYTVGYAQTYGLALMFDSWPGLVAAVFAQAAVLAFYFIVEKPHFERLLARQTGSYTASRRVPRKTQAPIRTVKS
jgi:protein-S-isoprenylcysteine O-methyltransferase Ste14